MAKGMLTTAAGIGRRRGRIDCPSYSSQGPETGTKRGTAGNWGTADRDLRSLKLGVDSRLWPYPVVHSVRSSQRNIVYVLHAGAIVLRISPL